MIIAADFEYKLDDKLSNHENIEFVRTKLLEFVDGFVMQGVLGTLNDMDIQEKKFSREFVDDYHLKMTADTYGVELFEDESNELESVIRESFAAVIDHPFVRNETELWLLDSSMSVKFLDTE